MEFNDLSLEDQFQIFLRLSQVDLENYVPGVCKQWKAIANEPIFRKNVLFDGKDETNEEIIEEINRSHLVKNLTLKLIANWDWVSQAPSLDVLTRVNFNKCVISSSSLAQLVDISPLVRRVEIIGCYGLNNDIISQIVRWKHLRWLRLDLPEDCDGEECIKIIADNCEHLEKLEISPNFTGITDSSILYLTKRRGNNLTVLDLNFNQLTTESFVAISMCHRLTHLAINSGRNMTDYALMALTTLTSLKSLKILRGTQLTAKGFQKFFREAQFSRLNTLWLGHCVNFSNKSVKAMANKCPELQDLLLSSTRNITDNGVRAMIKKCDKLNDVFFSGLNQLKGPWLEDIGTKLPKLETLYFNDCNGLSYEIIDRTAERYPKVTIADSRL